MAILKDYIDNNLNFLSISLFVTKLVWQLVSIHVTKHQNAFEQYQHLSNFNRSELLPTKVLVCFFAKEYRGTWRRSTAQTKLITERQNRYLRQLALQDRSATTRKIGDQWLKKNEALSICEPYIVAFEPLGFFYILHD